MTTPPILLEARLNVTTAETLQAQLARCFDQTEASVKIDASGVEFITTPALQLLLAFGRSFTGSGGAFQIITPSKALLEVLELLGLQPSFEPWMTENA